MNAKRTYLLALLLGSCSFALHKAVFYLFSMNHPAFALSALDVSGLRYTSQEVMPLLETLRGRPLRAIDTVPLKARLKALPMVEDAAFYKEYPSTLKVKVSERIPIAEVHSGGNVYVADASARVLPLAPQGGVPRLYADFGIALNGIQIVDENISLTLSVLGGERMQGISSLTLSRDLGAGFLLKGLDTVFYIGDKPLSDTLVAAAERIARDIAQKGGRRPKRVDLSGPDSTAIGYF